LETDISELKRVRKEIAENGYSSASMSSGGGSKSYTHLDLGKISTLISELTAELKGLRSLLSGKSPALPSQILVIYS
jgi:hypothetical protein